MTKDIILDKDMPFFATSDAPLALIKSGTIDEINTEMMQVRWNMFGAVQQLCNQFSNPLLPVVITCH